MGGALVFWTPSISLHALSPDYGTLGEPLILGLMLPVLVFGAVIAPGWTRGDLVALSALLGIWLTGPWFMMVSFTFDGGGFSDGIAMKEIVFMTVAFPLMTFTMSTYEGSFFALLITTVLLLVVFGVFRATERQP